MSGWSWPNLKITPRERGPLERDEHFQPLYPLSVYGAAAESQGFITEDASELQVLSENLGYTEDFIYELRASSGLPTYA